ncbi:hypothetical protein PVAP13_5KG068600 [Panicum virgatum]|uniref:Uncharacterized protein n=1 Tax=Panicum virgatum TaxID=38727 RepID=A0A8T0SFE3_PANVG|nr:hypothetical protein PVAP13_5KG068600 [Panicum virgatum]
MFATANFPSDIPLVTMVVVSPQSKAPEKDRKQSQEFKRGNTDFKRGILNLQPRRTRSCKNGGVRM